GARTIKPSGPACCTVRDPTALKLGERISENNRDRRGEKGGREAHSQPAPPPPALPRLVSVLIFPITRISPEQALAQILDGYTPSSVLSYLKFCTDAVLPTKTIKVFPNQKAMAGQHSEAPTQSLVTLPTGTPQGCMLSPALFTLFTSDCSAIHSTNTIVKFADDTTIVGLISDNDETHYNNEEIQHLTQWCSNNNLVLNTSKKTKEVIVDYRSSPGKEGSTKTLLPQEAETCWTLPSAPDKLLQGHNREHPLPQCSSVVWLLLGVLGACMGVSLGYVPGMAPIRRIITMK
ncbi:hypothetical protein L3Q82_025437, partial [Scortum barcoo]